MDSFWWFVGAVVVCGIHALVMWTWEREARVRIKRWHEYDADSQRRHDELMAVLTWYRRGQLGWSNKRRGEP